MLKRLLSRSTEATESGTELERLRAESGRLATALELSRGYVARLETEIRDLRAEVKAVVNLGENLKLQMAAPVDEAREHIQSAAVLNMDETSWRQMRDRA